MKSSTLGKFSNNIRFKRFGNVVRVSRSKFFFHTFLWNLFLLRRSKLLRQTCYAVEWLRQIVERFRNSLKHITTSPMFKAVSMYHTNMYHKKYVTHSTHVPPIFKCLSSLWIPISFRFKSLRHVLGSEEFFFTLMYEIIYLLNIVIFVHSNHVMWEGGLFMTSHTGVACTLL